MAKSYINGHLIEYDINNGEWEYSATKGDIEHIKFEDAHESWSDRCSGDGYKRIIDKNGDRVFEDNGVSVGIGYRPCVKCGKYPNENGDDACLGHLGNVVNACCGHGVNEGYIQFDNGITIRGKFTIERS